MKTKKILPFIMAFVLAITAAACGDDLVEPTRNEDDKDSGVIKPPPPPGSQPASAPDTLSIG